MELARLPSASLLPGRLSNEELFWHWRRSLVPFFDCIPVREHGTPWQPLESRQYHLGDFVFVDARFPGQRFVRDADWNRRHDDADHVLLQVFLAGRNSGTNGGTGFVQEPDGVYAVNLGYETEAETAGADTLSLVLPRDWLAEHLPALRDARGPVLPKGSMAARLFTDFALSLRRSLPQATIADAPVVSKSLVGLLGSLLAHQDPVATDAQRGAILALRRYVDDHLGDPDLGADRLCERFRMSRATLFRLFRDHGGVRTYIQQRRLMACFRAIGSPRHAGRRIYDIALDFGFANQSHLSTLFRRHFGMSPSEVREAAGRRRADGVGAAALAEASGLPDVEIMRRWALELGGSDQPVAGAAGPGRGLPA